MIALGNTACSAKLRETVDNKYRDSLQQPEKSRTDTGNKISSVEEFATMDSLTRYEHKIEVLRRNLEKVRTAPATRSTPRGGKESVKEIAKSPKSPRVKTEETFLDIDIRLLNELLEQRSTFRVNRCRTLLDSYSSSIFISTAFLLSRYKKNPNIYIYTYFRHTPYIPNIYSIYILTNIYRVYIFNFIILFVYTYSLHYITLI